ncbi:MAG: NirF protein [Aquificae bacterium]|nr:NirF protein [Aquificota bacterium]
MLHLILLLFALSFGEVFVVERETGRLAVIRNDKLVKEIQNLGNLNHATLKFNRDYGYLISRDGWLSQIDPKALKLVKKVRVGESTIGINFCGEKVLIANYAPRTVLVLSPSLEKILEINTGSRNVGIKSNGKLFVYALMDADSVEVRRCDDGKLVKRVKVGKMPFDAFLHRDRYIVGFFGESGVGILDLRTLTYKKVSFRTEGGKEVVLKVPHFGFWGIKGNLAYIPAVGERKVHVVDIDKMVYLRSIDLPGLPVFVQVSPSGELLGINYSGDMEDYFTLVDLKTEKPVKTEKLGKRILHFRFTPDSRHVYVSSYFENKVKKVSVPELSILKEIDVPTPSGVFIYGGE